MSIPILKNSKDVHDYFMCFDNIDEILMFKIKVIPYFIKYSRKAMLQFAQENNIDTVELVDGIKKHIVSQIKPKKKKKDIF